jgi:hypothetical protein
MSPRVTESRPILACVAALLTAAAFMPRQSAADETVYFIAPADHAPQVAEIVAEPASSEFAPAAPGASAELSGIDFAALANFAQAAPQEPEEIPVDPLAVEIRPFRPITQLTIDAALPEGIVPGAPDVEQAGVASPPWPTIEDPRFWGGWAENNFQWSATRLCHRPLYFEQVNVERYGYTVSPVLQPVISGAHFFLTIPTLPYKMVVQPPRECIYTLGYYRSGSRAPRRWHHLTWDPTAATVQGLTVTGLVFLIP